MFNSLSAPKRQALQAQAHPAFALSWPWTTTNNQTLSLPVSENLDVSTTNDELVEAKEREKKLTDQDTKVEETKEQRHTLESFVYDTRNKLSGAYGSFPTDSKKKEITERLQKTEDWLYEDNHDESEQDYTGKLKELKKLLEPIENQFIEENARVKATKALLTCIEHYHSAADLLLYDKKEKV
ncbi:putative Heat shock protein 70 family [Helianthus annuus]|nr:putative Heat shock protein 70 family [Helianthus annuus]